MDLARRKYGVTRNEYNILVAKRHDKRLFVAGWVDIKTVLREKS
jgi:hypothetical protein